MPKTGAKAHRGCLGWHGRLHLGIEKKKNLSVTVVQQLYWMFLQLLTKSTAMSHLYSFLVAPPKNSVKSRVISTRSCLEKNRQLLKSPCFTVASQFQVCGFSCCPSLCVLLSSFIGALMGQALGSVLTQMQWIVGCGCSYEGPYNLVHSLRLDAQKHIYSVTHM